MFEILRLDPNDFKRRLSSVEVADMKFSQWVV